MLPYTCSSRTYITPTIFSHNCICGAFNGLTVLIETCSKVARNMITMLPTNLPGQQSPQIRWQFTTDSPSLVMYLLRKTNRIVLLVLDIFHQLDWNSVIQWSVIHRDRTGFVYRCVMYTVLHNDIPLMDQFILWY